MAVMFDEEAARREYEAWLRQEVREQVIAEITERITEEVKKRVTERVTQECTENNIRIMVEVLKSLPQTKEDTAKILEEQFGLQPQDAADKVALYW